MILFGCAASDWLLECYGQSVCEPQAPLCDLFMPLAVTGQKMALLESK